jgi:hypothetical protein
MIAEVATQQGRELKQIGKEEAQKARELVEARAELPKAEEVKSAPTKEKEGEVEGRFLEGTSS